MPQKYPRGPVTPRGRHHIRKGDIPSVSLQSFNDQIVFWLMGGQSMPDPTMPESVQILGIKGLIPPWQTIDQQGATEDGVTFVDALYDPMEVEIKVLVSGRDHQHTRRTARHLIESLDVMRRSELGWMTHEMGYWWAPVRWFKTPPESYSGSPTHQEWTLVLRADSGFWQSYPDIDTFEFLYEDMIEEFNTDYPDDLGPMWPQHYLGDGTGYMRAVHGVAKWVDDPDSWFFTGTSRVVIGPYWGLNTASDDQTVSILINNTPEYTVGSGAANDIWCRMGRDPVSGEWNGDGIRGRVGWGYVQVTKYKNFVATEIETKFELWPPVAGETWTLQCTGRTYQLKRTNFAGTYTVINKTETGTNLSFMDADHRGVGFGMQAGAAILSQATPAAIREISADGTLVDTFPIDNPDDLGVNWRMRYSGHNDAYVHASGGNAVWVDNAGTDSQEVVNGPYKDFETGTDNQVIQLLLGGIAEWSFPSSGATDIWGRMGSNPDGSWNGDGIRARVTINAVSLVAFVGFDKVWDRYIRFPLIPHIGQRWTLVCGYEGEPRMFKLLRGGFPILSFKERGEVSAMGPNNRGVGFGVRAAGALITQASPSTVRRLSAGDNAEITQYGFLERNNAGDQPAYDSYTLYGPAKKFLIANGPGSTDMVEFGPLGEGEIVHIRTDPRRQNVFDYTDYTGEETSPVLFGASPSDQMTRRLKGRFTTDSAIPPKEPGMRVHTHSVACGIQGGNADSRIDVSLTPRRRYPQ